MIKYTLTSLSSKVDREYSSTVHNPDLGTGIFQKSLGSLAMQGSLATAIKGSIEGMYIERFVMTEKR